MRKIFWSLLSLLVLALSLVFCKRNTPEMVGPAICPSADFRHTDFSVRRISAPSTVNSTIDFSGTDGIVVLGTFNEVISWRLTMTGTSGASRTFTGRSNSVNVMWYGDSQTEVFFQNGENISIKLYASCKEEPIETGAMAITSNGITSFKKVGALVSNFNDGVVPSGNYGQPYNLNGIAGDTYGLIVPGSPKITYTPSPQGGNYFNISGRARSPHTGNDTIVWYFGGFDIDFSTPSATATPVINAVTALNADPSKVYLNCFISSGGVPNSQLQLTIKEKYGLSQKERKIVKDITWNGWKMISFKMSDLGIIDARQIQMVSFGLGASSSQQHLGELNVDLVLFTNDAPLQH